MYNQAVEDNIKKFERITNELDISIRDDNKWPLIFNQIIAKEDFANLYGLWTELLNYFLEKEKTLGHCHKGLIYWSLGVIDLKNGNINKAIENLEKSSEEDRIKLNGENRITASIGLLSIIKPLLHRYKDRNQMWQFDQNIEALYNILTIEEKSKFADLLLDAHNNFTQGKIKIILENFFTFITDNRTREIVKNDYKEASGAILMGAQQTYYSQIFSMGSIIEAMLDELFLRNNLEVWKIFKGNQKIQEEIKDDSKLNRDDYPLDSSLGLKIWMLRKMAIVGLCPISKESLLFLLIMGEYRDLIHPRRRKDFKFEVNRYVASILLATISNIAGDWWPENIRKIIELNYKLNS